MSEHETETTAESEAKRKNGPRNLTKEQIDKIVADLTTLTKKEPPEKVVEINTQEAMLKNFSPVINAAIKKRWEEEPIINKLMAHGLSKAQAKLAIWIAKNGKLPPKKESPKKKAEKVGPDQPA
jgi:hypothetical protein